MKKVFLILISILLVFTTIIKKNERNIEKDDKKREDVTTPISEGIPKTDENRESKEEKETETKNKQEEIISQKIELNDIPVEHEEKTQEQPKQKKEPVSESNKNNSNSTKTETKTKTESTKNDSEKKEVKNVVEEKKKIESGTVDSSGNEVKEEPKKTIVKEPWEQLGISKEDYENKPLYSWMRVDYNVSNCGSVNNCEALCMSDSEELSYTENVSCIQVYSHSGKYLGEMLKRN